MLAYAVVRVASDLFRALLALATWIIIGVIRSLGKGLAIAFGIVARRAGSKRRNRRL